MISLIALFSSCVCVIYQFRSCFVDCLFVIFYRCSLVEGLAYKIRKIIVIPYLVLIDIDIVYEMYLVVDQIPPIVFIQLDFLLPGSEYFLPEIYFEIDRNKHFSQEHQRHICRIGRVDLRSQP